MSVIYIVDHNESIYDVIKTRTCIPKKSPRYINYLELDRLKEIQSTKQKCGTMGPAEYKRPDPKNFLRRKKPLAKPDPKAQKPRPPRWQRKAPLPTLVRGEKIKKDQDAMDERDVIQLNVEKVKKLKPKQPVPKFVDTRFGSVKKIENSGLEPRYVHSKTFGKPPSYLLNRDNQNKQLVQMNKDQEELKNLTNCRYITRQERQGLLDGLKINWEEMQKEYQLLPIITDTIPKILKKSKMEEELKKLEKDIVLIEKHPYIYVLDQED